MKENSKLSLLPVTIRSGLYNDKTGSKKKDEPMK
jgi:hypothetical protein